MKIATEADRRGVFTIAMTNLPSHFVAGLPHVRNFKRIRLALGLHPLAVTKHKQEMRLFEQSLSLTSFIGEIGLDFSKEGKSSKEKQQESFKEVCKLLHESKKVISIHSRESAA